MPVKPYFTTENAKELGRKAGLISGASRRSKREADKAAAVSIAIASEVEAQTISITGSDLPLQDEYAVRSLARVRLQLDRVFSEFMGEMGKDKPDAQRLDRLIAAQSRLNEQERQLSGRPMPGSLKPITPRTKNQRSQPADFEPLPMARAAAAPRPAPISPAPDVEPAPAASLGDDLPQPPAFELRPLE